MNDEGETDGEVGEEEVENVGISAKDCRTRTSTHIGG